MRILVIEDEVGITSFLKQGLEEEGFEVELAHDGKSGLEYALSGHFDVLLVDWMLPGITGIELCKSYRKENKTTPIIFLTARDTAEDAVYGLQAGANDYIRKPFHFEELLERIRVQLRSTSSNPEFTLGPVSLNVDTHKVTNNGMDVPLTQKEFSLLEFLLRNKGKVCKRNRILDAVWGYDTDHDSGVIDVYINSLRKKLNLHRDQEYIQTIRGVGYMANEL